MHLYRTRTRETILENYASQGLNSWDQFWEQTGIPWGKGKPAWNPVLLEMMRKLPDVGSHVGTNIKRSVTSRTATALSLPLQLYRQVTESYHYHIGYFDDTDDSLKDALDRLIIRSIPHLIPRGKSLDLGCGIGGTTSLLADHAFPCLGIDPAAEQILFASRTLSPRKNLAFAVLSFDDLFNGKNAFNGFFDNIVTTEILQFFPDLDPFFKGCSKLLRPEGVLIVNEFATIPSLPWERVPYHQLGRISEAARAAGFIVESRETISEHVAPTLDKLIHEMHARTDAILSDFESDYPKVKEEIQDQIALWENITLGFENGDLAYESFVCRQPRGIESGGIA